MFLSLLVNNLLVLTAMCVALGYVFAEPDTQQRLALVPSTPKRRALQVAVAGATGYSLLFTALGARLKCAKTLLLPALPAAPASSAGALGGTKSKLARPSFLGPAPFTGPDILPAAAGDA